MAKRGGSKGGASDNLQYVTFDHKLDEECGNKIKRLLEIFPNSTKAEISTVLEFYSFDEIKAAEALTEDGGKQALSSWTVHGNNKSKNNKNKKRNKKRDKKGSQDTSSPANCTEGDDSSSLHSNNVDQEFEKDIAQKEENEEFLSVEVDETHQECEVNILSNTDSLDPPPPPFNKVENHLTEEPPLSQIEAQPELRLDSNHNVHYMEKQPPHSVEYNNNKELPAAQTHETREMETKEMRYPQREEDYSAQSRSSPRQRASSFKRSKMPSVSEDYSSSGSLPSQAPNAPTLRAVDKCRKDLNRQSVSLQRIENLLEKGLEESSRRLKNSFQEIRKLLDKRQEQLEQEMCQAKEASVQLLKQRQQLGTELKKRVDRSQSLSESEWNVLRGNIKQFVVERKYDEELGKTVWFCWAKDNITEEINKFGEVVPIKNSYNQQLLTAVDPAAACNIPEASHSPSPSSEDISTHDRNDAPTGADFQHPEEKVSNQKQFRVFSNRKYNTTPTYPGRYPYNNWGRNPYRGRGSPGMGGNFPRHRPFDNRYYGNDRTENRSSGMMKQPNNYSSPAEQNANMDDPNMNTTYTNEGHYYPKPSRRGQHSGIRQTRPNNPPFRQGRGLNYSRASGESFTSRTDPPISHPNGKQDYSQGNASNVNGVDGH